jgi:hypothetical protein
MSLGLEFQNLYTSAGYEHTQTANITIYGSNNVSIIPLGYIIWQGRIFKRGKL